LLLFNFLLNFSSIFFHQLFQNFLKYFLKGNFKNFLKYKNAATIAIKTTIRIVASTDGLRNAKKPVLLCCADVIEEEVSVGVDVFEEVD